jgi:hypothetical protein
MIAESRRGELRDHFNTASFLFRHDLAEHPLFALPRLARLAQTILEGPNPSLFTHRDGVGSPGSSLNRSAKERVADAVRHVGRPGSWIKLTRAPRGSPKPGQA